MEIIREQSYEAMMRETVEPELAALRQEPAFPVEGGSLRVEAYEPQGATASLLLLHGFIESAEKYREMIWYFTRAGYAVYAPDQRGHGGSVRAVSEDSVTHIDHFAQYVDDAEKLTREVILKKNPDRRLVLYAHSMGGAVAAFLLARMDCFDRAVLSSPMIAPSSAPLPMWMGKAMAGTMCLAGQGRRRAFIAGPYDPAKERFETSYTTSPARFAYYARKRKENPRLQNNAPSYRWAFEAANVTRELIDPATLAAIQTPVLLCQAGKDTVVRLPEQDVFTAGLPRGTLRRFSEARHEIYLSEDGVLRQYLDAVLSFLDEKTEHT